MLGKYKKAYIKYKGEANRNNFRRSIPEIISKMPKHTIDLKMVSMSGKQYFEDQLLSLFSFYYNVGIPTSWVIYNDGSYTAAEIDIFISIPAVEIKHIDIPNYEIETKKYPTLKKMLLLQQITVECTTIYSDSDVLFFSPFKKHIDKFSALNCYLVDENYVYFDNFIPKNISVQLPLNLGFLILNTTPDWQIATRYISERIQNNELTYWSDQTAMHLLAIEEKFTALPKDMFVVGGKDAFTIKDACNYKNIALRHFVSPIRHKMWQHNWKKLFFN